MAKKLKAQSDQMPAKIRSTIKISPRYHHAIAAGILYASILIFFHAIVFESKTYQSGIDTVAPWTTIQKDAAAEGFLPLWNPYIFCGMPGYASLSYPFEKALDATTYLWEKVGRRILSYFFFEEGRNGANLVFYLTFGFGVYLFVFHLIKNKPIAVIVALMMMYATYIALLIALGHTTKLAVLSWFPYVFLIVDILRRKFSLMLSFALAIFVRLMLQSAHVQLLFYIFLSLGIYFFFFLIRAFIKKEAWKPVIVSGLVLALATGMAFLMGATQYFSTLEYNPYSIRGSNPIQTTTSDPTSKTVSGGLDYEYATNWSFSPGEMMTFFVPSWYGFGPLRYQGPLTQNQAVRLNLYWGDQPSVDGPQYMGVVVVILAMIGFYRYRKEPFVQYLGIMVIFSLLVSFGKEFSLVYDLMYKYFPLFNKFRVPSMILIMVQFFVPLLAGFGIASFVSERPKPLSIEQQKKWKYLLISLTAGIIIVFIGKDIIKDIYTSFFPAQEIAKNLSHTYGKLNMEVVGMLMDFVYTNVVTDIIVGLGLLLAVFGAFYAYQKNSISQPVVLCILLIAVMTDLWRVAAKTTEPQDRQEANQMYETPGYVKALQQDSSLYRTLKIIDGQPIYDNLLAYWRIYSAYGYHPAKLRIFQDMVDVAGMGNPLVWQLMNVKYIITNQTQNTPILQEAYSDKDLKVYNFRLALPHAFFVNKYEVADGLATLKNIASMSFDPRTTAYTLDSIKTPIDPPKDNASVIIKSYRSQDFELNVTATGNNLLFISDAYYPMGWKAYIDGAQTTIYRLNYMFRGIVVPMGKHTVTMKFEPASFALGMTTSFIVTIIIWGGLFALLIWQVVVRRKQKIIAE